MIFREATLKDIKQIMYVRNSVSENKLSNPNAVTEEDCITFITKRGKGWVCEIDNKVIGFSIADLKDNNIWALFVHPGHNKKGIGKRLHNLMLDWYFRQTRQTVWLGTDPGTRAETFYGKMGWQKVGIRPNGETKFEMNYETWRNKRKNDILI